MSNMGRRPMVDFVGSLAPNVFPQDKYINISCTFKSKCVGIVLDCLIYWLKCHAAIVMQP